MLVKADEQSSIPKTHKVEGRQLMPRSWPLTPRMHAHTLTQINAFLKLRRTNSQITSIPTLALAEAADSISPLLSPM